MYHWFADMLALSEMRLGLTKEQRDVLAAIWRIYIEKGKWVPRRVLHVRYGGEPAVRSALPGLGGGMVFENPGQGPENYHLSLLCVVLFDEGAEDERPLTPHL